MNCSLRSWLHLTGLMSTALSWGESLLDGKAGRGADGSAAPGSEGGLTSRVESAAWEGGVRLRM